MVSTPKPNGFADHYPVFKWLFHWEYTPYLMIESQEISRDATEESPISDPSQALSNICQVYHGLEWCLSG